ncbi:MAG: D-alanyl-D-alanine carboxypeptidase [Cyanobacteria bacterium SID2]|nr:D-alanyl-D-alanine carboxypeptidase [Cyanobacteria bacterium SID2]MBP0003434.1 D-alanyl-D-alanine carboxypeptidase [Cyanobacteria bacterium SBC]
MTRFSNRIFVSILTLSIAHLVGCTATSEPQASIETPSETSVRQATTDLVEANDSRLLSPDAPDAQVQQQIEQYLDTLAANGFDPTQQGVWIQTEETLLANRRGTTPFPAASVTKIATTLAALRVFEIDRRFVTEFKTTGEIRDGVLNGDLVVAGNFDPMFVWEDAIEIGNLLNEQGIDRVKGNLVIAGTFYMNFEEEVAYSGELLKQGLNANLWTGEAQAQYQTLSPGTPRPQVEIAGDVRVVPEASANAQLLIRHESLPVPELLKLMNRYSNNSIAHTFANAMGGADVVVREVLEATGVPPMEIQLTNGSGLGRENQISPRTAVAMYLAIERELKPHNLTVSDVVAIAGVDDGILSPRSLPTLAVIKSGSLNAVSTISGGLPTQQRGVVWFAVMNGGADTEILRLEQERLLNRLESQWGKVETLPPELAVDRSRVQLQPRNEVMR